eukprot:421041-Pyramimonas_sp.AAC.1
MARADNIASKRRTDEHALDCRICAAVQTDDIIEKWAHNTGRNVQNDIRCHGALRQGAISWLQDKYPNPRTELQDKDHGHFRTACG